MIVTQLLRRAFLVIGMRWPRKNWKCLHQVHSREVIRRILDRERVRADRTGDSFSVVTFTPRLSAEAEATWSQLVNLLQRRLRCTDEPGWFDEGRLCAVLPHTPPAGAWTVADDVCLTFPEAIPPPLCSVYAYPWTEKDENGWNCAADLSTAGPQGRRVLSLEPLFLKACPLWKRSLDVTTAGLALLVLLPLLGMIALAITLTSPGPVLFRQRRSGRGGKPFILYKFRTMVMDAEARKKDLLAFNEQDGPAFKIKKDPRITFVGRLLRRTSLDELPQLWNVLGGDMTLVGPRPLPCAETAACDPWQRHRLDVMPGLTCIWQVRGRSEVSFAQWVRMDIDYIQSLCLRQDLKLLLQTLPVVLLGKGH